MNPSVVVLVLSMGAAVVTAARRSGGAAFAIAVGGRRSLALDGLVLDRYLDEGGQSGGLGAQVGKRRPVTPGPHAPLGADQEVVFARGTIYVDSSVGQTKVVLADEECR